MATRHSIPCLGNRTDREAWQPAVHQGRSESDTAERNASSGSTSTAAQRLGDGEHPGSPADRNHKVNSCWSLTSRQDLNQVFQPLCTLKSLMLLHTQNTPLFAAVVLKGASLQVQLLEVIAADVMTLSARFLGEGGAGCAHPETVNILLQKRST